MKIHSHSLIAAIVLTAMTALPVMASSSSPFAPRDTGDRIAMRHAQERTWYFSGTARYVCTIDGREHLRGVSGLVTAGSRGEALRMARESGRAQTATWGRVISVDIQTMF